MSNVLIAINWSVSLANRQNKRESVKSKTKLKFESKPLYAGSALTILESI